MWRWAELVHVCYAWPDIFVQHFQVLFHSLVYYVVGAFVNDEFSMGKSENCLHNMLHVVMVVALTLLFRSVDGCYDE